MIFYMLDEEGEVVPTTDVRIFGDFFFTKRFRCKTQILDKEVSTVFLGINHDFLGKGTPVVFETVVFGKDGEEICERCCTLQEALAQHTRVSEEVLHSFPVWKQLWFHMKEIFSLGVKRCPIPETSS